MPAFVPFPPYLDRPVAPRGGNGADYNTTVERTGNTFWHTMLGTLWSTDAWFRNPASGALTPWGIGGALDGEFDGTIMRWLDYENTDYSPWSSGPWIAPGYGDGPKYVSKFGVNGINAKAEAIEFSGMERTPLTSKQWVSGIWLTAAIIHDGGRDSEEFLWNMHHEEICYFSGKRCPWPRITDHTLAYQHAILQLLRHYEGRSVESDTVTVAGLTLKLPFTLGTGAVTPPPVKGPIYVDLEPDRSFVVGPGGATVRQWGERRSRVLMQLPPGKLQKVAGYYHGEKVAGSDIWYVQAGDPRGRIHISGFDNPVIK